MTFVPERVSMMLPGLDRQVDYASTVCAVKCICNLQGNTYRLSRWQRSFLSALGKQFSFQELHHQELSVLFVAEVVHRTSVG